MVSNHFIIFDDTFFLPTPPSYFFVIYVKDTVENTISLSGYHPCTMDETENA